ncbi:MAG: tetratricopeptide repeat protein [Bacteroidetes bacterium]|nr:tetratricopeptide repeat protein [Bacteroidota bacterium]MDA0979969.1 tetratricopeptide repeat protein [Bacteroidota bacterium]
MKQFLLIAGCLFSLVALGQKEVVSAYNANKEGDYREAATYIEQAILIDKAAVKEKVWRYRGEIYLNISSDSTISIEYPQALRTAMESYLKAKDLDVQSRYKDEIRFGLAQVQTKANNIGIKNYVAEAFDQAGSSFDLAAEVARNFDIIDTMAVYNAALCYEKADLTDLAIERYLDCAAINYQVPNVFLFVSTLYRNTGKDEAALKILQDARVDYPREQSLIIEELNIYLTNKDFERAKTNLVLAAEQDPTNEILWFSLGSVLDNIGMTEDAIVAYKKAIEVKSDYFDANYNLGALYFNQAVKEYKEADELWKPRMSRSEASAQKKLEDDSKEMFSTAKPFLESAFAADNKDVETIRSLRDIYARTGEDDKLIEMQNLLKSFQ